MSTLYLWICSLLRVRIKRILVVVTAMLMMSRGLALRTAIKVTVGVVVRDWVVRNT